MGILIATLTVAEAVPQVTEGVGGAGEVEDLHLDVVIMEAMVGPVAARARDLPLADADVLRATLAVVCAEADRGRGAEVTRTLAVDPAHAARVPVHIPVRRGPGPGLTRPTLGIRVAGRGQEQGATVREGAGATAETTSEIADPGLALLSAIEDVFCYNFCVSCPGHHACTPLLSNA